MVSSVRDKIKNSLYFGALMLALSVIGIISVGHAGAAGSAALNISPTNGTYTVGDYVTFNVTENSGLQGINAVESDLNYDKNVLQFVSIDTSQSAFTIAGPMVGGGGVVQIARAIDGSSSAGPSRTGSQPVASITFKVINSAVSTNISFNTTSKIVLLSDHSDIWNKATAGATIALKAAPVSSGGGGTTSGGTTSGGGSSTGSSSSKSSGGSTSKPSPSPTPTVSSTPPTTTSTQPVDAESADSAPQVLDPTTSFVAIKVLDDKDKTVEGATVKLDDQTAKTDAQGVASFTGVGQGQHKVTVSYSGKTAIQTIDVKQPDSNSTVQQFKVKLAAKKLIPTWAIYTIIGVAVLFILGFIIPRRKPKIGNYATANYAAGNVVVGGSSKPVDPAPLQQPQPTKPVQLPQRLAQATQPGTIITADQSKSNKEQQP